MTTEDGALARRKLHAGEGNGRHTVPLDLAGSDERPASLWERYGRLPPAARVTLSVLISLALWGLIWLGVRYVWRAVA